MKWLEQVWRAEAESRIRTITEFQPEGKIRRVAPKNKWHDKVEGDLRSLAVTKWKEKAGYC